MNKQLEMALAELIDKSMDGIDSASQFLLAEVPEVIQQLLMWHAIESAVFSLLMIALILAVELLGLRKYRRTVFSDIKWDDEEMAYISYYLPSTLLRIGLFLFTWGELSSLVWLKIWIAPKVWLLEYAARLIN